VADIVSKLNDKNIILRFHLLLEIVFSRPSKILHGNSEVSRLSQKRVA